LVSGGAGGAACGFWGSCGAARTGLRGSGLTGDGLGSHHPRLRCIRILDFAFIGTSRLRDSQGGVLADTPVWIGNRVVGLWELTVVCGVGKPRAEPDVARGEQQQIDKTGGYECLLP
jgi:hypothetical protein